MSDNFYPRFWGLEHRNVGKFPSMWSFNTLLFTDQTNEINYCFIAVSWNTFEWIQEDISYFIIKMWFFPDSYIRFLFMYSEAGFWNSEMATMKKTVKKPMLRPMYMIVPTVFTLTDFGKPCKGPKHILNIFFLLQILFRIINNDP